METAEINSALENIAALSDSMLSTPEDERIALYRKLDPSLLLLEGFLTRSPIAHAFEDLNKLKAHLIAMARLDDPDGNSDEIHHRNALQMIEQLRSALCRSGAA